MIQYNISFQNPHKHFIDFSLTTSTEGQKKIRFQLPAWRPGRYELGNFSQNIYNWKAYNTKKEILNYKKINKDLWEVNCDGESEVIISYSFYANQLDAGSCYLDEKQLYINPVHCIFYVVDRLNEPYKLDLNIPDNYIIACSLNKKNNSLFGQNFDEIAESPIICSDSIKHDKYFVDNIKFNLWFQGPCKLDWKKIKNDFSSFTKTQISQFDSFPCDEYHFFFQITPYVSSHGVEHTKNTVILLGPGNKIMSEKYNSLLHISSHELYHTWNIKSIRPKEMYPYDYSKENYFRTGYVAEGVTTYMGDLMLHKSNVFSWDDFLKTQNQNLERHLMNYGRFNLSVADSGFDSWLDGYKAGSPNRKVSIYADGALCMLMIDLEIINFSNGKYSLSTVMNDLYINYALKNKGYSEEDFIKLCEKYGGSFINHIFNNHVYGTFDYIPSLNKTLDHVGLKLIKKDNENLGAHFFGFLGLIDNNKFIIKKVEPNSEADINGIAPEDEIIKINGQKIDKSINQILENCGKEVNITLKKKFFEKEIKLNVGNYFTLYEIGEVDKKENKQVTNFNIWTK